MIYDNYVFLVFTSGRVETRKVRLCSESGGAV